VCRCVSMPCILTLIVLVVSAMSPFFLFPPSLVSGLDTQAGCRVSIALFWAVVELCRVILGISSRVLS
jgi:hypothetical protein